ncbi:hypothetical protein ACH4YO_07825 [Streptomyces noursei]|uniref:hypothetical protein n=1 Tax=Streptomyces noursei TaxID=1971 RepID=UPI0033EF9B45
MALKTSKVTLVEATVDGVDYSGNVELTPAKMKGLEADAEAYEAAEKEYTDQVEKLKKARDTAAEKFKRSLEAAGVRPVELKKLTTEDLKKIRLWASRKGHTIHPKARIPGTIRMGYDKAAAEGKLQDDEKI